jgi:hypothetical protein
MASVEQTAQIYQDLAQWHGQHGQMQLRDRFLVLLADTYYSGGKSDEAEKVRGQLLAVNPHHLIKPFGSFTEALKSIDVRNYIKGLRRQYAPDKAAELLKSLGSGTQEQTLPKGVAATAPGGKSPSSSAAAPAKVYRFQEENAQNPSYPSAVPIPPPRQSAEEIPRRPVSSIPIGRASPVVPTAKPTAPISSRRSPWLPPETATAWQPEANNADRPEVTAGAWVATGLFLVLIIAGLGLAVLTFAGPFWNGIF